MEQFTRFIESIGFEYQTNSMFSDTERNLFGIDHRCQNQYETSDGYKIVTCNAQLKFGVIEKRYSLYFNGEILLRNKEANFALDDLEIIRDRLKCKIRDAALRSLLDIYEI
jgi:hypothetical protein